MSSGSIPDSLPIADGDKVLSSAIDSGLGLFTIALQATFSHEIDARRLGQAVDILLDAQPILGCRFVVEGRQLYWDRLKKGERTAFYFLNSEQKYGQFTTVQVDSRTGPQIKVGLYRGLDGDHLIIKNSHQVGDGGGLHDIARELSAIYNRLKHEPGYQPEPNIHGSRSGKQIIGQIPWTSLPVIIANFIKLIWSNNHPKVTHILPLSEWQQTSWIYKIRHIPPEHTARIMSYGKNHQATLNDILIAAYLRSLVNVGNWNGKSALRLQMTVDLRTWYLPTKKAGGICNLSAFEYINLGIDLGSDFHDTVSRVSAITRARKASYFGLGEACLAPLATLLPYQWLVKMVDHASQKKAAQKNAPGLLTNTGPIPPQIITFDQPPRAVWLLSHVLSPPCFCTCVSSYGETITLSAGASQGSYALVDAFLDQMIAELPD